MTVFGSISLDLPVTVTVICVGLLCVWKREMLTLVLDFHEVHALMAEDTSSASAEEQVRPIGLTRQMGMVRDLSAMAQVLLEEERQNHQDRDEAAINGKVNIKKAIVLEKKTKINQDNQPEMENMTPTKIADKTEKAMPPKKKHLKADTVCHDHPEKAASSLKKHPKTNKATGSTQKIHIKQKDPNEKNTPREKVDPATQLCRPQQYFLKNRPPGMQWDAAVEAWKVMDQHQRKPYQERCAAHNVVVRERALLEEESQLI